MDDLREVERAMVAEEISAREAARERSRVVRFLFVEAAKTLKPGCLEP